MNLLKLRLWFHTSLLFKLFEFEAMVAVFCSMFFMKRSINHREAFLIRKSLIGLHMMKLTTAGVLLPTPSRTTSSSEMRMLTKLKSSIG